MSTSKITTKPAATIAAELIERHKSGDKAARVDLLAAAKFEAAALKEAKRIWAAAPKTPVLDYMNGAEFTQKLTARKTNGTPRVETSVVFYIDGKDMHARHNRLSALAARNKLSVDALRAMLTAAKITDVESSEWTFVIEATGKQIGAHKPGKSAPKPAAKPKASKSTTTTKAASKPAAKQVTPIPKRASKTTTARKSTSARKSV